MSQTFADTLRYDALGLVTAVAQDHQTGQILMVAHMNRDAVQRTLEGPYVTYFSRSRQSLWVKGETSGHVQILKSMAVDCDRDCLLLQIESQGPACHTGETSCFFTAVPLQSPQTKS